MPPFPKILYLIGSAVCRQLPSHSFFYQGEKLPLDARETGIYLGFLAVFVFWLFKIRKKPNSPFPLSLLFPLVLSILYLAFDGFSSVYGAIWVSNLTRLFSGLFFGQALGLLVLLVFSHSLWGDQVKKTPIIIWPEYLALSLINFSIFLLFLLRIKPVLFLAGYLIIFGLVIFVWLVNLAFLSGVFLERFRKSMRFFSLVSSFLTLIEFGFLIWLRNFFGV